MVLIVLYRDTKSVSDSPSVLHHPHLQLLSQGNDKKINLHFKYTFPNLADTFN